MVWRQTIPFIICLYILNQNDISMTNPLNAMNKTTNMNKITYTLFSIFCLLSVSLMAQPPGMGGGGMGAGMGQNGRFYGKIVDAAGGKPVPAASIQLVSSKFNMAQRKMTDTVITGSAYPKQWRFQPGKCAGNRRIQISGIGYRLQAIRAKNKLSYQRTAGKTYQGVHANGRTASAAGKNG
jgi:hypothetical protein